MSFAIEVKRGKGKKKGGRSKGPSFAKAMEDEASGPPSLKLWRTEQGGFAICDLRMEDGRPKTEDGIPSSSRFMDCLRRAQAAKAVLGSGFQIARLHDCKIA